MARLATLESSLKMYFKKFPIAKVEYNLIPNKIDKIKYLRKLSGEAFPLIDIVIYVNSEEISCHHKS